MSVARRPDQSIDVVTAIDLLEPLEKSELIKTLDQVALTQYRRSDPALSENFAKASGTKERPGGNGRAFYTAPIVAPPCVLPASY